ncbi:Hypothetical predicted protein [Podarcis lilfordi]|uniref:Uncharacterized protein n=1 Tax=Podarcis lilfordi TaxID=74358 RepID=A0AA35PUW0_9SAUR|nr:Hypothetical predicted protein [Podarcis lilfordi]
MWRQEDSLYSGQKRLLRRKTMKEAGVNWSQPLEIVGRGLGNQQQPSGAGKPSKIRRREARQYEGGKAPTSGREPFPNIYFALAKSLEGRGEHQDHASRDEAPAPAPGTKIDRPSRRFPAVPDPRLPHPPSVPRAGMAPTRPYLAQKQQPRLPPIQKTSQVIPEPGETLAAASVPGRSGWSPDARTEEFRVGQLIRSARRRLSLGAAASREGLEPRQRPLASQGITSAPLWLLLKPPSHK